MAEELKKNRPGLKHETTDADIKPILIFLVGLSVLVVVFMGLMGLLLNFFQSDYQRVQSPISPVVDRSQVPPEPRLQSNPSVELNAFQRLQDFQLSEPAWQDEENGVVRLPIERAMQLAVERDVFQHREESETGEASSEQ